MADETVPVPPVTPEPPTDQTGPLDAGHTTTEFSVTKWVTVCAIAVAILGGVTEALSSLTTVMPGSKWIGVALTIVGMLSAAAAQVGYALSRASVKKAALQAGVAPKPVANATANLNG